MAEVISFQQSEISYCYSQFLPDVVRVLDAGYEIDDKFRTCNVATVYGNAFQASLTWTSRYNDERIRKGALARIYWPQTLTEADGLYAVVRVVPIASVDHSVNLFDTIPSSWSRNFESIERAKELWSQLPCRIQALFNEIFWDDQLFRRYVCIPASINGHHNGWGGNLRHAVEMAEHAERIALDVSGVSNDFLILAGLLYNAPNAEGYRWSDGQWGLASVAILNESRKRFQTRLNAILERRPELLAERERETLWQILFGNRIDRIELPSQPNSAFETEILSLANRLSCVINLRDQGGVQ
jgi:hypothetical protein